MAGMDWFRWHHGAVTDPKFQLVARKSGASLPDVLAVWAYVLETASQSVDRGHIGAMDCEALDCLFGFPPTETRTANILAAMEERELIKGNRICSWEKRQPKREREDATNADRQATHRAKKNQVTPSNASDNQKTPREEESRYSVPNGTGEKSPPDPIFGNGLKFLTGKGLDEKLARSFLGKLRKDSGDIAVIRALSDAMAGDISDPIPWLTKATKAPSAVPERKPWN